MNSIRSELREVIGCLKGYLESERDLSVSEYYREVQIEQGAKTDKERLLKELHKKVSACKACSLYKTRSRVVFGSGSPEASLMFIGEAPGHEEDVQGLPFVGDAGQMLTKIILAMGYRREDVYIANCLKCRPPMNRSPLLDELTTCEPNLIEQIEIIKPKLICCLGRFASQLLLKTTVPISKLRGKFYDYHGIKIMPTFHPAYLLRNPKDKKLVWSDMKKLKEELGR